MPFPPCSCALDTKFEISATSRFWFSKYSSLKFYREVCVSEESHDGGLYHATSSRLECSWYKIRNFSDKSLLVLKIFQLKILSGNLCIRRTSTGLGGLCRATSSKFMFSRYKIRNFRNTSSFSRYSRQNVFRWLCHLLETHVLLIQSTNFHREISSGSKFSLKILSNNTCIRSTTRRNALLCHIFKPHVFLIQWTFKNEWPLLCYHLEYYVFLVQMVSEIWPNWFCSTLLIHIMCDFYFIEIYYVLIKCYNAIS